MSDQNQVAGHTPGPWGIRPVFHKTGYAIFITDNSKAGTWQKRLDDKYGIFSEKDACLIAAAPEMLTALRGAVCTLAFAAERDPSFQAQYEQVSAAIDKATGASCAN